MENNTLLSLLPFAEHLTGEEMRLLSQTAYISSFTKGEIVHTRSQQEGLGAVLVLSGLLGVSMISDEGKQIMLYRLGSEEMSLFTSHCILSLLTSDVVVEGEKPGKMLVVPIDTLTRLEKNIRVENTLSKLALSRCAQIMGALERVLFVRVDKRLAIYLLQEAERTGQSDIRLTHEQIARDISSAREVVSRTLGRFAQKGLVEASRGIIRILDPKGLAAL